MLEPYDGKLSRTVLRGKRGVGPLPYPVKEIINNLLQIQSMKIVKYNV